MVAIFFYLQVLQGLAKILIFIENVLWIMHYVNAVSRNC